MQMDQKLARDLFENGAVFMLLDLPEGSQFGMDCNTWQTGPKFRGVKMIPPGIHFITFSACSKDGRTVPKIGFFYEFKQKEVFVRHYDSLIEDLNSKLLSQEELDRYRKNLKSLDEFLAPYPYDSYKKWFSLSRHITFNLVQRLQPTREMGRISSQCQLVSREMQLGCSQVVDRQHPDRERYTDAQGLPILTLEEGTAINFTDVSRKGVNKQPAASHASATPAEGDGNSSLRTVSTTTTQFGMDASGHLDDVIKQRYNNRDIDIIGELQFAFIVFLVGQVYEGFEQWKVLLKLMTSCNNALVTRKDLFESFVSTVFYQIKEIPSDFFVDIVERENFVADCFTNFFLNAALSDDINPQLMDRISKFRKHLEEKYGWNFEDDTDDNAPVVVEVGNL